MALRVEAEMVFPTGGVVVSNSGVDLSGVIQGSMRRYKVQVADGQMRLSSNDAKGMAFSSIWGQRESPVCKAWRLQPHSFENEVGLLGGVGVCSEG